MDFASGTSAAVEVVTSTVNRIERYVTHQQTCNDPDQRLAASSLLVIYQSILVALRRIQDSLGENGWNTREDGNLQSLASVLASCQVTFKILLDKVKHAFPMTQDAASSPEARDIWPTSDIEAQSQNISKIATGLQLIVEALNLYASISYVMAVV
jgi:hypothetical protein